MGLLDALTGGSQGGYGGLLDALMYQSQQKPQGSPFPAPPEPLNPYEQQMMDLVRQQPNGPAGGFMDGAGYRNPASAGFPSPQPAAANPPPSNDAGPIAIGNYQMPRMGSTDLYQPQQAMLPPNAQPAQGQLPQAAPQAPQALPPALGGGMSALSRIGSPDGLIARLTGNDSRSVAQQNLKAQYDALVPIVGHQKALLAVMNPKANEILMGQTLEAKLPEYGVVRKDDFDRDVYGWKDPKNKSVTEYAPPTASAPAASHAIPPAPAGIDPKIWRNRQSERSVQDAMPASFDDTAKMRTELSKLPSYQNISQAAPIYKSMHDAAGRNTKAADLNMVYGLGKIMDPGSVVREGEIHMANNAQGWQEKLNGVIAQINGQGGLTPEGRQMLMAEAHSRMQAYKQMYDQDAERFRGIASRNKADPRDVVHDFGEFQPWVAPKNAPSVAPQIDDLVKKYGPK